MAEVTVQTDKKDDRNSTFSQKIIS